MNTLGVLYLVSSDTSVTSIDQLKGCLLYTSNHYNCPIVTSYAENIKNNMEGLEENHIRFMNPFMAFTDEKTLTKQLVQEFKHEFQIPEHEVRSAAHKAWEELSRARADVEKKGEEVLSYLEETGKHGSVLEMCIRVRVIITVNDQHV